MYKSAFVLGSIFLLYWLFYDFLPVDFPSNIMDFFSASKEQTFYKVVPANASIWNRSFVFFLAIALLLFGISKKIKTFLRAKK